jgi:lantibiotic modifying enzyme
MTAWCHGAPGILLSLLSAPDPLRDEAWRGEVEAAAGACLSAPTHKTEHVCCGNLSRAEALFTAARRLGHPAAGGGATKVASGVARRAAALGHFRLSAVPYDYRAFAAAFFQGTSGAAYQLLRMASGGRLPSVLALESYARSDLW